VQHDFVADGDEFVEDQRCARIAVEDRSILNIRSATNRDSLYVTSEYCAKPDTGVCMEMNITDHGSIWRDVTFAVDLWADVIEGV
jgi:hypothetical protein